MKHQSKTQDGFTIIELMIATTVFGVMLLLATTGMMQIGRAYYKGITASKTQEIARSIETDITDSIQTGGKISILPSTNPATPDFNLKAVCVGNIRYSFVIDVKAGTLNTGVPKSIPHVLWQDIIVKGRGCEPLDLTQTVPPVDVASDSSQTNRSRDLLASNMRLTKFLIEENDVHTGAKVEVRVLYGDEDVIDKKNPADPADDVCVSSRSGGQFCAFSELKSFVKARQ